MRTGEKKLFSNFGISNGYFNHRGYKIPFLLGDNPQSREINMDNFEFYQIEFEWFDFMISEYKSGS